MLKICFGKRQIIRFDCYNQKILWQKVNYVHENPVRAGLVEEQRIGGLVVLIRGLRLKY
jgi:hypothetical protein